MSIRTAVEQGQILFTLLLTARGKQQDALVREVASKHKETNLKRIGAFHNAAIFEKKKRDTARRILSERLKLNPTM